MYQPETVEKNDNRISKSSYMGGYGQTLLPDYQAKVFVFLDIQLDYISQSLSQLGRPCVWVPANRTRAESGAVPGLALKHQPQAVLCALSFCRLDAEKHSNLRNRTSKTGDARGGRSIGSKITTWRRVAAIRNICFIVWMSEYQTFIVLNHVSLWVLYYSG